MFDARGKTSFRVVVVFRNTIWFVFLSVYRLKGLLLAKVQTNRLVGGELGDSLGSL